MRDPDELAYAHFAGTTTTFVRSALPGASCFGGEVRHRLKGLEFGPRRLHQACVLSLDDLKIPPLGLQVQSLPLLHGLSFDGCHLKYAVSPESVDVLSMSPLQSSEDWPYEGYPEVLPMTPLKVGRSFSQAWEDFVQLAPSPSLAEASDVMVLVPPPVGLGFSLWGEMGDAEEVTLVFHCKLQEMTVLTYNVCS